MAPRPAVQDVLHKQYKQPRRADLGYKQVNKCHFKLISLYFYLMILGSIAFSDLPLIYNVNG